MGVTLCRLYESSIFGVRAVFGLLCLSSGCTGPCLLDIGGVFDIVLTGACPGCWAGPPLLSVIVTTLSGVESAPHLLEWKPLDPILSFNVR